MDVLWPILERAGAVAQRPAGDMPSVVEHVTGQRASGSWWGGPGAGRIFEISEALHDRPDVHVVKLAAGRVTFVHRRLWPALFRVATDAPRRARIAVSPLAARLLEASGAPLRLDGVAQRFNLIDKRGRGRIRRAADELEKALLVASDAVHTESGRHSRVLQAWERWASADVIAGAAELDFDTALAVLQTACCGTLLPAVSPPSA